MSEKIDVPSYYIGKVYGYEARKVIEDWSLSYNVGTATSYLLRCGKKTEELDASHKHDSSRRDIIKSIIDEYKSVEEKYLIPDLQKVLDLIRTHHKSNEVFFFLCKECHRKYDEK